MNENNATNRQRHWKIQDDVERVTKVSGLQVERSRGDKQGRDSGSESGEILRSIMKVELCTAIEPRGGSSPLAKLGVRIYVDWTRREKRR